MTKIPAFVRKCKHAAEVATWTRKGRLRWKCLACGTVTIDKTPLMP